MYNIIGAGLAGSMLSKSLKNSQIEHRVFDAKLPFAASVISENLFSDTWLKDVSYIKDSLDFIYDNYEVEKKTFYSAKKEKQIHHLPIPNVLLKEYIYQEVINLSDKGCYTKEGFYKGINIVCAGFLAKKLLNLPSLDALTGHGFFINGYKTKDIINTYRPYTHEKIMNWHDGSIWYGDSTAIRHRNYMQKQKHYISNSKSRMLKHQLPKYDKIVFGSRPMNVKNPKEGMLLRISDNNYVLNGGWKDGLVIYPYLISKLRVWLKL